MSREPRKYRRTETGRKAWESPHSGLPSGYRRILGLIHGVAYSEEVLRSMQDCAVRQVQDWLDELETLGFLESLPFVANHTAGLPQAA